MKPGDVVQIIDPSHHWFPALLVVDEVKDWGIQGYATAINNDPGPCPAAYIRVKNEQIARIGEAIVVSEGIINGED